MRVAIVTGVVVPHDAISLAVAEQARLIPTIPGVESVDVFAQHFGMDIGARCTVIHDPWSLLADPVFSACDVAIFHWGIRYAMFDVLTLLDDPRLPRPVVHFHNCTPAVLVPDEQRPIIEASVRQIEHVVGLGVALWTYSEFNERTLRGMGAGRIDFVPIPIDAPAMPPGTHRSDVVQLLTVGRRVPAKGLHVLLEALGSLTAIERAAVHLRVVGSAQFSDVAYLDLLSSLIDRHGLAETVTFIDEPTHDELWDLYAASDVVISASFHEGLCVPIIEGYAMGCRAIGTTAGNLPFIVQPPDPCVDADDPAALAEAIRSVVAEVRADPERRRRHPSIVDRYSLASARRALQVELYRSAAVAR